MRDAHSFARRFIGGENVAAALEVARGLGDRGFSHTLNHLGEHVSSAEAARAATDEYLAIVDRVAVARLPCMLSVKLSQIGLEVDPDLCAAHLGEILAAASLRQGFVRVDMEESSTVESTLTILERMWTEGRRNVAVVLQAYLRRIPDDLARVRRLGARVRLCKGAYKEPPDVAFPDKTDVDAAFVQLMRTLLTDGHQPAFATHDPRMIDATCTYAAERGLAADTFEFQMLYGVRRDLQAALIAKGYPVRIYVPFGREWFPYFMRRLAERPANVGFIIRSILHEQRGPGS
jgi:proline dehydrogenase